ncbi:MAG: hypothetical protein ACJA09_002638 [Alcanivorax sp.]|jgi:hypothetical protein
MISTFIQALAILALAALSVGCATPLEATSDFDQNFDFSKVQKIAIQPTSRTDPATIQISDMQIERVTQALADELEHKGFQVVDDKTEADMFLSWHLVTHEKTDVRSYDSMSYYNCWRCGPAVSDVSVRQYTQGTFIVDMIDPARNKSAWRSIIQSRLSSKPHPDAGEERRQEAAQAIFVAFPPN